MTAPPLGSDAPKWRRRMRARAIAPAHMAQGSSVTQRSQSSSREVPSAAAAARSATISAWAVGSAPSRMRLRAEATSAPARVTTAPTGTSPAAAAARASSSASRIGSEKDRTIAGSATAPPRGREALLRVAVGEMDGRGLDLLGRRGHRRHRDVGRRRSDLDLLHLEVEGRRLRLPRLGERDRAGIDERDTDKEDEGDEDEKGAHRKMSLP